ncbi:MAG: tetratricopeptide repeat protein [Deltaproteobacteria bacterium]|nr:tetratricopeptide repeat protein [Deltaproteobacteria bacterium]
MKTTEIFGNENPRPVWRGLSVLALFIILSLCLYAPAIKGPFYLDDADHLQKNPGVLITKPSPSALWKAAWSGPSHNRPLAMLSFAMDHLAYGVNPSGFRVTNIILHALTAFLLFLFLETTFSLRPGSAALAFPAAFFSAILWMCHPLQTQAVSYIVQRMAILAALFSLSSLFFYAKARTCEDTSHAARLFAGSAISMVLAFGSKENAAVLPFLLILYEWFFFRDLSPRFLLYRLHWIILAAMVFLLLAWAYSGFDFSGTMAGAYAIRDFTLEERLFTQARVIVFYLSLFLLPLPGRQNLFHDFPVSSGLFSPISTACSIFFILILAVAAVVLARRLRLFSFFVLFFFATLAIESTAVGLEMVFEHRMYLPSVALTPLMALGLFAVFEKRRTATAAICVAGLLFSSASFARNRLWGDGPVFFADAAKKNPDSARAWSGLAFALMEKRRFSEAINPYTSAIAMDEEFIRERLEKGKALAALGRKEEGMAFFHKALSIRSRHFSNLNGLAGALAATGRSEEALALWARLLKMAPGHYLANLNAGSILLARKEPDRAATHFETILRDKPDDTTALILLGDARLNSGNIAEAADLYRKTARLDPHAQGIWERLAAVGEKAEKPSLALPLSATDPEIAGLTKKLEQSPENPAIYNRLGVLYREKGRADEAVAFLEKALALAPGSPVLLNNLGLAQLERRHYPAAQKAFEEALAQDPKNMAALYNMVCLYSVKSDFRKAALWLDRLLGLGFSDFRALAADRDLANFVKTPQYRQTLEKHGKAKSPDA